MTIFQKILIISYMIVSMLEMSENKIVDFSSDNPLFHPFVQEIRNYRTKDYLIKLLKRNLQQKLRKYRKLSEDKEETCNCKCNKRSQPKFLCENEGRFANPASCRKFFLCFRNEMEPISVTCPKGFAFDSFKGKCTRKSARDCMKKTHVIRKLKRIY